MFNSSQPNIYVTYIYLKNPQEPGQSLPAMHLWLLLLEFSTFLFSSSLNDPFSLFCLSSFYPSILPFNYCNLITILAPFSSRKMDFDMIFSYCFYAWDASKMVSNTFCLFLLSGGILLHQRKNVVINFISNC